MYPYTNTVHLAINPYSCAVPAVKNWKYKGIYCTVPYRLLRTRYMELRRHNSTHTMLDNISKGRLSLTLLLLQIHFVTLSSVGRSNRQRTMHCVCSFLWAQYRSIVHCTWRWQKPISASKIVHVNCLFTYTKKWLWWNKRWPFQLQPPSELFIQTRNIKN